MRHKEYTEPSQARDVVLH